MAKAESDIAQNYAGAFDGHLGFGKAPALLIVDVVMAYLEPSSALYAGVEAALASNERLAAAARTAGVPVISGPEFARRVRRTLPAGATACLSVRSRHACAAPGSSASRFLDVA